MNGDAERNDTLSCGLIAASEQPSTSPSIVPLDRLDRDIYLLLEDFGAHAGYPANTPIRFGSSSLTRARDGAGTQLQRSPTPWRSGPLTPRSRFRRRCRRSSPPTARGRSTSSFPFPCAVQPELRPVRRPAVKSRRPLTPPLKRKPERTFLFAGKRSRH